MKILTSPPLSSIQPPGIKMSRFSTATNALLCITLSLFSNISSACSFKIRDVSDYVQHKTPDSVIFLGTVLSVGEKKVGKDGTFTQNIEFRATRWFGGKAQEIISVQGVTGNYRGTDCEGIFDFSAKNGEEWLIFGQLYDGKVKPDRFRSQKLVNGTIPDSLLKELK